MTETRGWLIPYKVILSVQLHWITKFSLELYVKNGGETAGDEKFVVPANCTLIETFSDEATDWIRKVAPDGFEVIIQWEKN